MSDPLAKFAMVFDEVSQNVGRGNKPIVGPCASTSRVRLLPPLLLLHSTVLGIPGRTY